jgi:hypothetical protein
MLLKRNDKKNIYKSTLKLRISMTSKFRSFSKLSNSLYSYTTTQNTFRKNVSTTGYCRHVFSRINRPPSNGLFFCPHFSLMGDINEIR